MSLWQPWNVSAWGTGGWGEGGWGGRVALDAPQRPPSPPPLSPSPGTYCMCSNITLGVWPHPPTPFPSLSLSSMWTSIQLCCFLPLAVYVGHRRRELKKWLSWTRSLTCQRTQAGNLWHHKALIQPRWDSRRHFGSGSRSRWSSCKHESKLRAAGDLWFCYVHNQTERTHDTRRC